MPMFSRDNSYHRSLVSANTQTVRRNLRTHYVSNLRRPRHPLASRHLKPACHVRHPAGYVQSTTGGGVECQEVFLLAFARSKVRLTTVICFVKVEELPPGSPLPLGVTGRIIPYLSLTASKTDKILRHPPGTGSAPGDPVLFG